MKPPPYPKYKPSGVEWIGEVPEHWGVDRLKWTTVGMVNGVWGEEANGVDDIICVRVADFNRESSLVVDAPSTLRAVNREQRKGRLLRRGDLLIEKSGGGEKQLVGCAVYFDHEFDAVCSNFVARIPTATGHSARYWLYVHAALYAGRLNYPAIKQTTGIQNLDSATYLNIKVGYPPVEEQAAIADFLDHEMDKIDTLVVKKRTLIERLKEKRIALISRTVTRGLPPEAARQAGLDPHPKIKPSGIDWLGEVPEHWDILPFTKYVADRSDYRGRTPEKIVGGIFLVTAKNVRMGYIDYDTSQEYVAEADYDEIMRRGLPKIGDILFTTEAPLGNVASVDREDIALAQRIIRFRMNSRFFDSGFILYGLMSDHFQIQLQSLSTGSTAAGLKASKLPILRVVTPPLKEQSIIAGFLDSATYKTDCMVAKVETAIECLQEYRATLVTAAVTGKIDVREAAA